MHNYKCILLYLNYIISMTFLYNINVGYIVGFGGTHFRVFMGCMDI